MQFDSLYIQFSRHSSDADPITEELQCMLLISMYANSHNLCVAAEKKVEPASP